MRIRSIRPEFWTSEDIAALDWSARLIFIGLWSYVDDNGVGRDVERLINADLFALEADPHASLMQITRALMQLETGGQVCRYEVDGRPYLHICAWAANQVISRPSKSRYPALTCADASKTPRAHAIYMSPHVNVPHGEGEKGRRGEGEKGLTPLADTSADTAGFDTFWNTYGKKVKRADAAKKWRIAIKKPGVTPELVIAAAAAYIARERANEGGRYIADPSTWLHGERWNDIPPPPPMTRVGEHRALALRLAAEENHPQIGAS